MIRYESEKEFVYPGGVLIPVTVRRTVREGTLVRAFENLIEEIKALSGDVFSEEYISAVAEICQTAGYHIEPQEDSDDLIYERFGGGSYSGAAEAVGEEALALENLTDFDIEEILFAGERAYMLTEGGRILSIAAENPITEIEGAVEIAAVTAPGYRGRGYAAECINALCADIDGRIIYLCSVDNPASARTAEKCGFGKTGRVKYFVAYDSEE